MSYRIEKKLFIQKENFFEFKKKLIENTNSVDLVLVTNSLKVTISVPHFFHLFSAVETVMNKKFGNQLIYKNYQ